MKDEEIIKALECCAKSKTNGDCEALNCPCFKDRMCIFVDDDYGLQNLALDLINRQKAEIEKLRQAFEIAVKEQDIIQEQKDFECKKAVSKFVIELKSKIVEEIKNTNEQLQEIYDRDILMSGEGEIQTFHTVINIIDNLLKDWYGDKK